MRRRRGLLRRRTGGAATAARKRLQRYRRVTILAIGITALLLLVFAPQEASLAQETITGAASPAAQTTADPAEEPLQAPDQAPPPREAADVVDAAVDEARTSTRRVWTGFIGFLPKLLVAIAVLVIAWLITRLLRVLLRRVSRSWERGAAIRALIAIGVWLLAAGVAISVLVGDMRALVGSLGLIGLALSWALQTPIESFTGWLLNSFRGYYRVGDRIAVGEIHGEVYRVDFLNTTLWEIGSPGREGGYVKAEQPTGRLITFPNSEVLAGSIINFTRDFPWVWDEYEHTIANESDLRYAIDVVHRIADEVLAENMRGAAHEYERILQQARLERSVTPHPEVFVTTNDWGTLLIVRYLVDARQRRLWKSRLITALTVELAREEHRGRIIPVYPRQQIQIISPEGVPQQQP